MKREIKKKDFELLASFRYLLRKYLSFSEEAARAAGLTPQQHQALLAILGFADKSAISIGELAERLQIKHHSAVGLANRLQKQGLVERTPYPGDRRKVLIGVTPHGWDVLEKLSASHRDELRRIGPQIRQMLEELDQWQEQDSQPE